VKQEKSQLSLQSRYRNQKQCTKWPLPALTQLRDDAMMHSSCIDNGLCLSTK